MRASRTYKSGHRRRLERLLGETAIRVALLVFVIWTLAPVAWMIVSSLLNQIALTSVPPDLSPGQLTLDNYRGVLATGGAARDLQDPLTFRDLAHVCGALRDALTFAGTQVTIELNSHQGNPPLQVREDSTGALVPVGTGVLLLGGRGNLIENNRIHGNFLAGVAAIQGVLLEKNPQARDLERNVVRNNQLGLNGTDVNGADLMYDGNGKDNCFSLDGVSTTFPADRSTFGVCSGPNPFSQSAQAGMLGFIGENALKGWNKHPHPAKKGYTPLEVFE